ncbi:hypothetical protein EVAR_47924_1 [Eumeta japonica]|uniref:Uncharacterized protein n=1 Tax=Eumeta variegata TaxID=151549 RepID=A0A4C1Y2V4_EUMVA|nr:hypothetical protein EVAR_47924_1 [Eumeta japonica]
MRIRNKRTDSRISGADQCLLHVTACRRQAFKKPFLAKKKVPLLERIALKKGYEANRNLCHAGLPLEGVALGSLVTLPEHPSCTRTFSSIIKAIETSAGGAAIHQNLLMNRRDVILQNFTGRPGWPLSARDPGLSCFCLIYSRCTPIDNNAVLTLPLNQDIRATMHFKKAALHGLYGISLIPEVFSMRQKVCALPPLSLDENERIGGY